MRRDLRLELRDLCVQICDPRRTMRLARGLSYVLRLALGAAPAERAEREAAVEVDPRAGLALAERHTAKQARDDLARDGLVGQRLERVEQRRLGLRRYGCEHDIGELWVLEAPALGHPRVK